MANIGFRIHSHIERPSKGLIQKFKDIPVANISDTMGRIACIDTQIKPFNKTKLLGPALTVRVPSGDNLMLHKAMDIAQPGDVIVVDAESGMGHALIGEVMFRYSIKRGIAGYVLDGCIRDVDAVYGLDLPVYARGVNPRGPYKNGPGEINGAINCGGQVVHPGDIMVGDSDGVVVISPVDAEEILEKALKQNDMEIEIFRQIEREELDRRWVDEALAAKGCEII
jgi:RraA family protein